MERLSGDRLPASDRLEDAIGVELAQRLVHALTRGGRFASVAAA